MSSDPDNLIAELVHNTPRAWRAALDLRLKPFGMSQSRWRVLLILALSGGSTNQTALAKRLSIEPASLVALLDRLEQEELLQRLPDPNDRRSKLVSLTAKGKKKADKIHKIAMDFRDELLADVPVRDLEACIRALSKISENAERLLADERTTAR